ncbi:putative ABC transporter [Trypanosoma rangeli]|uniref:Putative ABC transporter n=1 Tax=Trypanosoma rangeli TaxID=5698 RepID=A0A3S5IRP6_TRYRA|nr:putative ABC transporter [Trypanosoma rangeli]RNF08024.1 putative ABC transporter [Trypanosoma rangeli]|eukprot:RNF08024.1 putative ABC transporter [Trypanosoma rangeli]
MRSLLLPVGSLRSRWLLSGLAARGGVPPFLTQLLAASHCEATERKRAWKGVMFEICVSLICVASTPPLWWYFGDQHCPETRVVDRTAPHRPSIRPPLRALLQ